LERRYYPTRGQCATIRPIKELTNDPGEGYYINLQIDALAWTDAVFDFNWHVFLTVPGEPYLDFAMFKSLDMISVSPLTYMATAINVRIYKAISTEEEPCIDDTDYQMPTVSRVPCCLIFMLYITPRFFLFLSFYLLMGTSFTALWPPNEYNLTLS
jgi:hypothetical protein